VGAALVVLLVVVVVIVVVVVAMVVVVVVVVALVVVLVVEVVVVLVVVVNVVVVVAMVAVALGVIQLLSHVSPHGSHCDHHSLAPMHHMPAGQQVSPAKPVPPHWAYFTFAHEDSCPGGGLWVGAEMVVVGNAVVTGAAAVVLAGAGGTLVVVGAGDRVGACVCAGVGIGVAGLGAGTGLMPGRVSGRDAETTPVSVLLTR